MIRNPHISTTPPQHVVSSCVLAPGQHWWRAVRAMRQACRNCWKTWDADVLGIMVGNSNSNSNSNSN